MVGSKMNARQMAETGVYSNKVSPEMVNNEASPSPVVQLGTRGMRAVEYEII